MKIQSAQIYLRNVRFHALHGVAEQEHLVGNDYVVNLTIDYPLRQAALSDHVEDTLNYAEAYRVVRQVMTGSPCQLLERVAYLMGEQLMRRYPQIIALQVDIRKENPPMGADSDGAGVILNLINDKTK